MPLVKGRVIALVLAGLLTAGIVMVPLLENYALPGVLVTAAMLYAIFYRGWSAAIR